MLIAVLAMDTLIFATMSINVSKQFGSEFQLFGRMSDWEDWGDREDPERPISGLPMSMVNDTFEITVRLISGDAIKCLGHAMFEMRYLVADIDKKLGLAGKNWDLVKNGKRLHFCSWKAFCEYGLCYDIELQLVVLGDVIGSPRREFEHYQPPDSPL